LSSTQGSIQKEKIKIKRLTGPYARAAPMGFALLSLMGDEGSEIGMLE
jgi:hypothetical protein